MSFEVFDDDDVVVVVAVHVRRLEGLESVHADKFDNSKPVRVAEGFPVNLA